MNEMAMLIGRLKERADKIAQATGDGKAADWAAYQHMVGERAGINFALVQIEILMRDEDYE